MCEYILPHTDTKQGNGTNKGTGAYIKKGTNGNIYMCVFVCMRAHLYMPEGLLFAGFRIRRHAQLHTRGHRGRARAE